MKKRITYILLFIGTFLFANVFLFSKPEVVALNSTIVKIDTTSDIVEKEEKELIDINELKKQYNNNDIVGVIKIDSLDIDGLVLKSKDNIYYLNHDINKNKSIFGTLFVDYRNSNDLSNEKQINIYGHNSRNKDYKDELDFYNLNEIVNKKTFDELSDIYFYVENDVLIYKPIIVKVITTDYEYTRLNLSDQQVLKKHLKNLTSNTMYCKDNCSISEESDIIILQTCYYDPTGSYLLLIGIK